MKEIVNKKAFFNYRLGEKIEAGIALLGDEIKSIRSGRVSLADSYVLIKSGEAFLINAHIGQYEKGSTSFEPRRDRKLLLHKKEIDYLVGKLAGANLTLVPVRLHFRRNYAKLEIAIARGKRKYDKREALKKKAIERETQAELRREKLKAQKQLND